VSIISRNLGGRLRKKTGYMQAVAFRVVLIASLSLLAAPQASLSVDESAGTGTATNAVGINQVGWCSCDFFREGRINLLDLAELALWWGSEDCHLLNWCETRDINHDGDVNFKDLNYIAVCWLDEDTSPPTPNPMRWDPNVDESGFDGTPREVWIGPDEWDWGATMRADPSTFDHTGLEFFFECRDDHRFDSGWISFPDGSPYVYTVVINKGFAYSFRVRARDQSVNNASNITGWSPEDVAD
jgi:hypothetical protein